MVYVGWQDVCLENLIEPTDAQCPNRSSEFLHQLVSPVANSRSLHAGPWVVTCFVIRLAS